MYILMTMMLLNVFLMAGINNVCSTFMEEIFVEEILAEYIFMDPKIAKFWKFLPIGTNHKSNFCKDSLNCCSQRTKMYFLVIYLLYM